MYKIISIIIKKFRLHAYNNGKVLLNKLNKLMNKLINYKLKLDKINTK